MSDFNLTYKSGSTIEALGVNECTIHRCSGTAGRPDFWHMWFYVARETDGVLEEFCVPVIPHGGYTESGPGGRSWGLNLVSDGTWQISPSINAVYIGDAKAMHAGPHPTLPSLWHKTPALVGVPTAGEPWQ